LGPRFSAALAYASEIHGEQVRKGTAVPYIAHLLAVAALVMEAGADEDTAIGALLHDAVEDQGGRSMLERIRARFGQTVAGIVESCSDTDATPKPAWRQRKEAYVAALAHKSSAALLVSLADKVHNAGAILNDYQLVGEQIWHRFAGGRDGTLWYYRALADAFRNRAPKSLWQRLEDTVCAIEAQARAS
jgi:(p)ppGpp synthase/HD superfamily hydrolase